MEARQIVVGQPILYKGDMANQAGRGLVVSVREVGPTYSMDFGAGKLVANPREAYDVRLDDGRSFMAVNASNIGGEFANKSCRFMLDEGPVRDAAELAAFNEAWADTVIANAAAEKAAAAEAEAAAAKASAGKNVKFMKYYVTDGKIKAKVFYSLDNRTDGRKCVTLYARDYDGALGKILPECYKNDTDLMTDYFDEGRAVIFESNPLYKAARARAEMREKAAA
jgi:hypothetical protein